jgi:single-strand DNA-binding protein
MLNKQIVQGRLTAKPELKMTPDGTSVCNFTIASEEDIKRKDGTRDTDFIDCVAWGPRAEFVSKYFTKGSMVIVEGRPKPRKYKDKNDVTHKVTELRADTVHFADSKRDTDQNSDGQNYAAPGTGACDFVEVQDDEDLPF